MAGRAGHRTEQGLPQFLVAFGVGLAALSGAWLWWFGDAISFDTFGNERLDQRFELQRWVLRVHVIAALALLAGMAAMVVTSLVRHDLGRSVLRGLFAVALVLGLYTGYSAEWNEARVWAVNIGSRVGPFTGSRPAVPDDLVRAHLALVPALLAITAIASVWHDRRRR